MQEKINEYFSKLCSEKFFKNDDETIIGKAKDVIQNLKDQIAYAKNKINELDELDVQLIVENSNQLIDEITHRYTNKEDVVLVSLHPMAGFYVLQNKETLYEELKAYYEEENSNGN